MSVKSLVTENSKCCEGGTRGVEVLIGFTAACDIQTWPELKSVADDSLMENHVTLDGDIVLKEGKTRKLYRAILHTPKGTAALEGELGSKMFKQGQTFEIQDSGAKVAGFAKLIRNACGVWDYKKVGETNKRLIGTPTIPATMEELNYDAGTTAEGKASYVFGVSAISDAPFLVYEGADLPV